LKWLLADKEEELWVSQEHHLEVVEEQVRRERAVFR
jgi:hypothetical protein